jgi:protein-tyrosine phosphatase
VIKILFICHGNICRSVAAEMVLKQMIREKRISDIEVDSAAATREEIGNDIYPPMKRALQESGYRCEPHAARQTVRADYDRYDCLIGMDTENLYDMKRIYGGDPEGKISLLRAWAGEPGMEIDDPWYTRDFGGALKQIEEGCRGIFQFIIHNS